MTEKYYIGLCTTYHDPAVAIVNPQGDVLFAEATERYLQYKRGLNCEPDSLARVAKLLETYCNPNADFVIARNWSKRRPFYEKFCSLANYFSASGLLRPRFENLSTFMPKYKLFHMLACQKYSIARGGISLVRKLRETHPKSKISILDLNHHLTHAAAACCASPFDEAACMVVDSYGERGANALYRYRNGRVDLVKEIHGIESLGFYYMKLTELCGFDWIKGEEWKVMGLAPYGSLNQEVLNIFRSMLSVNRCTLKQNLQSIHRGFAKLDQLISKSRLDSSDLAHTGQHFFASTMESLLANFYQLGISENLVLGGGCALNSSFNGNILARTPFRSLYIPSAPADDGTALGAAFVALSRDFPDYKPKQSILTPYLGSTISKSTLKRFLKFGQTPNAKNLPKTICEETSKLLAQGALVGWIQGRAEFGPRSLGNRSILADPRQASMRDRINSRVKYREKFRPFAPSIMHEYGGEYFEDYQESPYMDRTLKFKEAVRAKVPAVVHIDNSGRLQSVKHEWNPRFYELIANFHRITGIPLLLNTSFNIMGKPMVHSIEDALSVFFTTGLDALVIDDYLFVKPAFETG